MTRPPALFQNFEFSNFNNAYEGEIKCCVNSKELNVYLAS